MKKKLTLLIMIGALSASLSAHAENKITDINISDGIVTISGKTDNSFTSVGIVITSVDSDRTVSSVCALEEAVSDETGNFEIEFKAEGEGSLWNNGDCVAVVRAEGDVFEEKFHYYTTKALEDAINGFISSPVKMSPEENQYKIFDAIGINVGVLSDSQLEELPSVIDGLAENMSMDDFIEEMNKSILTVVCNDSKEYADADLISDAFSDFKDLSPEKQQWVSEALAENKKYQKSSELKTAYEKIKLLCEINYSRPGALTEYIEDNADVLDIRNSDEYEEFSKLSSSKKGKISEKLAGYLKKHDAYTVRKFLGYLEDATDDVMSAKTGGGGGGSAGGSTQGFINVKGEEKATVVPSGPNEIFTGFDDMQNVQWAEEAVNSLYEKGIVTGVSERLFEPDRAVTREEFIAMLVRGAGVEQKVTEINFTDVNESDWYYEVVKTAYSNGITKGMSDKVFGAGEYITRQDMAVMVSRVFDIQSAEIKAEFTDKNKISDYAKESIDRLCGAGIINGMGDGSFSPFGYTTRAQAAVVLYRILGK